MNKFLMGLSIMSIGITGVALADEPAIVNDPAGFWDKVKQVVDRSEPRVGAFYNAENGKLLATTAAKLYSKDVGGYALEGVLGYGIDKLAYVSVETDVLAGLSKLTGATLHIPWLSINVGPGIGYTWGNKDGGSRFAYGAGINASGKF